MALPKQVRSPGAQGVNRGPGVSKFGQTDVGSCAPVTLCSLVLTTVNDSLVGEVCLPLGGE